MSGPDGKFMSVSAAFENELSKLDLYGYLSEHNLRDLLSDLIEEVLIRQPDDLIGFCLSYLNDRNKKLLREKQQRQHEALQAQAEAQKAERALQDSKVA